MFLLLFGTVTRMPERGPDELLNLLDLTEYEKQALEALLELGRTTAPDLSEATGIPKARIYGVLDSLSDDNYIKTFPGRPKEYEPRDPSALLDAAVEAERQAYESFQHEVAQQREEFIQTFQPIYEQASESVSPTEELFHVVSVGEASERATREIYKNATDCLHILTKSFEYFDAVEPAVQDVLTRGLDVRVLFLDPELLSQENRALQQEVAEYIIEEYPEIQIRFSASRLPWRGTIADPSMDYESGQAILLVEEPNIPLHKRQAAVTENGSFVAGLERYFTLTWEHDTLGVSGYPDTASE